MVPVLKFPFSFDTEALRADLDRFGPADWTPHFNTRYYQGDWSGIALRSTKNAHVPLYADPTVTVYEDTDLLARCAYIPEVKDSFKCDLELVRFLRVGPGDEILEHRDYGLSFEDGVARVHIPVKTSPDVEFYLDGELVRMEEGEAWYLNFDLKHRVKNKGAGERVHLVIDCVVNDWLAGFFPAGPSG
jgi:hypothetical protein